MGETQSISLVSAFNVERPFVRFAKSRLMQINTAEKHATSVTEIKEKLVRK